MLTVAIPLVPQSLPIRLSFSLLFLFLHSVRHFQHTLCSLVDLLMVSLLHRQFFPHCVFLPVTPDVLGNKPRTLCIVNKFSTTQLHPKPTLFSTGGHSLGWILIDFFQHVKCGQRPLEGNPGLTFQLQGDQERV